MDDDPETAPPRFREGADPACCAALEGLFGDRAARTALARYRRSGPPGTTRRLLDALIAEGVEGATVLDVGGGIGALQHGLLEAGAAHATAVDVSSAYLAADREEATRRGLADRLTTRHGDFVALAPEIETADIVTLERVICCYPDVERLVGSSAAKARRLYGLVYPRDAAWDRWGIALANGWFRLTRSAYRGYVHSGSRIASLVAAQGLEPIAHRAGWMWTMTVYRRAVDATPRQKTGDQA